MKDSCTWTNWYRIIFLFLLDSTSRLLNRWGMANLPLFRILVAICQKSGEPSSWEVMDFFLLLAYASLTASITLLQQLLTCLNFILGSENLFSWYKQKKWFLWSSGSSKPWRWMRLDASIPTWTHSKNSLAAAEALSLRISSHGTSLRWSQRRSQLAQE